MAMTLLSLSPKRTSIAFCQWSFSGPSFNNTGERLGTNVGPLKLMTWGKALDQDGLDSRFPWK